MIIMQQQKQKPLSSSFSSVVATAEENSIVNNDKLYSNFIYSIKTQITRTTYLNYLKYYMDFLGVKTFKELIENKPQKIIESDIKEYLVYLRNKKKLSYRSASMYLVAIKKFYYVNS